MKRSRIPELEDELRTLVQARTGYLVLFDDDGCTIEYGKVLNVGLDHCVIRLLGVGTSDRHRLTIETTNIPRRSFRETKDGWFALHHVADHIVEVIGDEAERRGERSRARMRLHDVRESIRRLKKQEAELELPPVTMQTSLVEAGKIDLVVRGLNPDQVKRVLATLSLDVTHSDSSDVWGHLLGDDII